MFICKLKTLPINWTGMAGSAVIIVNMWTTEMLTDYENLLYKHEELYQNL